MGSFLERLKFFKPKKFSQGHGKTISKDRAWEDAYRARWQYDKIVRSTHGTNCTGSCSWKIYVKNGLVTWETQQTDYPRTRPDLPNHEPRGCARGASYSWYMYSANRIKYPLIRGYLLKQWREFKKASPSPVDAWASLVKNESIRKNWQNLRGMGGFVRSTWEEVNEIIVSANIYTIKQYGPDRIVGFSPIPAMSMISYAAGSRYLNLIGGVPLSFYDWYCDLPPTSPQTWGEQTDVPESADWYNSTFLIAWGSNVPQTRTPDAHFFTEVRYKGAKTVAITPDYAEVSKLADLWLHPKQGTDAALAMAMGHVILKEFYCSQRSAYFDSYVRRYTDLPLLVVLETKVMNDSQTVFVPGRYLRASDFADQLHQTNQPQWKTVAMDVKEQLVVPNGSIGFRWGPDNRDDKGLWNLETTANDGIEVTLKLSLMDDGSAYDVLPVAFPYFGGIKTPYFESNPQEDILVKRVATKKIMLEVDGEPKEVHVATVFDLLAAHYGIDRGLGGQSAISYDDNVPYTPAWQENITGVSRDKVIAVARDFAINADKTRGKSMIIIGAGMNHWYHSDMNYRSIMNLLMLCGCVGQSGGGWAHYVGQEKLRPQTGWLPLAFALDWIRPPRQQNSTSFFYAHTDQWRYEKIGISEILSPLADQSKHQGHIIDYNVRAERMGWLPSTPQLQTNPLTLVKEAERQGVDVKDYVINGLKSGTLTMSCEDPDRPNNWPRNMFVWRSNLLGSSGKGHEYFLKHLLGTSHGVQGKDLGADETKPQEVKWHDKAPEGKLDLLVTLDFRMSTTCLYSDIVLPTATWYEKNDLNTSDMHPFIHPLSVAVDPAWEARSDWEIYKGLAKQFSKTCKGHLDKEKEVVLSPLMHDTPTELSENIEAKEWRKGECDLIPGKTAFQIAVVEHDYLHIDQCFTSLGPLMVQLGNGGKGIYWNTQDEVAQLKSLNGVVDQDKSSDLVKIETDIDAAEVVLMLAPETNGQVATKAWQALSAITGREHAHLSIHREDEKIRFRDIQAQPRKIISSPTWSGLESEKVSYTASYTNVHEMIPWRTLTGRQSFYQDHLWMRDFGESLASYRPPIDLKALRNLKQVKSNGYKEIVLNFITPHQKWGIHSTYTDNLLMLTLCRGGPVVWLSESDAKKAGIADNDWIELYNANGAIAARAIVSQRVHEGMAMMYHAQEKTINTPGSEITGMRGGIHNSVTRIVMKPTHMIGGYAQYSYGFNYYGTIGTNRDELVMVRKMKKIDWLDNENRDSIQT